MSIKKYIYFGPYLEYTPKQIVTIDYVRKCTKCKKKRVDEICPTCKQQTTLIPKDIDEPVFDYIEGYKYLQQPHCGGDFMEEDLLIPGSNEGRPEKFNLDDDNYCGSIPLPTEEEIQKDTRWFMDKIAPVIEGFKKHQVEFQLKYGFVIHYS